MEDDRMEQVLTDMVADDPDRGRTAESVAEWITAGEGVGVIDPARVQRFAWYELPLKWSDPPDRHRRVLAAAAELFDGLDMPGYASVCRSPETAKILDAYATSSHQGFKAFRKAYERSGVDPPDLDDFVWGDVMGIEEAVAQATAERALEEAMTQGALTPGARGWKSVAGEVTAGVLDSPHPTLLGQTHRTAIVTERLEAWLRRVERHSPTFHDLRSRHVNRLLHPIPVPVDVAERIKPITWFLGRVDEGALLLSRLGRRMRDDPQVAWRVSAAGLSDGEWSRAVAEVFALLLLEGEHQDQELEARAAAILSEAGSSSNGEPPDAMTVDSVWWVTRRLLMVLGGIERGGDWRSPITTLTGFGEATLLEQIRVEATGPRSRPW